MNSVWNRPSWQRQKRKRLLNTNVAVKVRVGASNRKPTPNSEFAKMSQVARESTMHYLKRLAINNQKSKQSTSACFLILFCFENKTKFSRVRLRCCWTTSKSYTGRVKKTRQGYPRWDKSRISEVNAEVYLQRTVGEQNHDECWEWASRKSRQSWMSTTPVWWRGRWQACGKACSHKAGSEGLGSLDHRHSARSISQAIRNYMVCLSLKHYQTKYAWSELVEINLKYPL